MCDSKLEIDWVRTIPKAFDLCRKHLIHGTWSCHLQLPTLPTCISISVADLSFESECIWLGSQQSTLQGADMHVLF